MHRLPRRVAAAILLTLAGTGAACALALPFEESDYLPPEETTTYVERSLNRQAPLTVEHPPVPPGAGHGSASMAGFCAEDGTIRRVTAEGQVVLRQREVCENVAPRTLWPGHTDARPAWPAQPPAHSTARRRGLVTKG